MINLINNLQFCSIRRKRELWWD